MNVSERMKNDRRNRKMKQKEEETETKEMWAGSRLLRVGKGGVIELPLDAVDRLNLKEGDELECIYGTRQIGLSPVAGVKEEVIFSLKDTHLLLWKIPSYIWGEIYSHCQ